MATIVIRPATAQDRAFILDSFARSYQSTSAYASGVHGDVLVGLIEPLLALWTCDVAVTDDDTILGWICYRDPTTIAWLNVKLGVRRRGVARALLHHAGVQCPSELECAFLPTKNQFALEAERHGYTLRFRPYLALQAAFGSATVADEDGR